MREVANHIFSINSSAVVYSSTHIEPSKNPGYEIGVFLERITRPLRNFLGIRWDNDPRGISYSDASDNSGDVRFHSTHQRQELEDYFLAYTHPAKLSSSPMDHVHATYPVSTAPLELSFSFALPTIINKDSFGTCYPFTPHLQELTRKTWSELENITLIRPREVNAGEKAHVYYGMCNYPLYKYVLSGGLIYGLSTFPDKQHILTSVNQLIETVPIIAQQLPSSLGSAIQDLNIIPDAFTQLMVNHETAHAVGLRHSHTNERDVSIAHHLTIFGSRTPNAPDYTADISKMSYYSGNYAQGMSAKTIMKWFIEQLAHVFDKLSYDPHFGVADIYTLQRLYGKNKTINNGSNSYVLNGKQNIQTIYDAGGKDTYDASVASDTTGISEITFINANPDLYHPSIAGRSVIYTAYNGPHILIGNKWNNIIHGSVFHGNEIRLEDSWGAQTVFSAGFNNTIHLNPHAYGAVTLDYQTHGVPIKTGQDTVYGFRPDYDRIITPEGIKKYNIAILESQPASTLLTFNNSRQTILLQGVHPQQILSCTIQEAAHANEQDCPESAYNQTLKYYRYIHALIMNIALQFAIGALIAYKKNGTAATEQNPPLSTKTKIALDAGVVAARLAMPYAAMGYDLTDMVTINFCRDFHESNKSREESLRILNAAKMLFPEKTFEINWQITKQPFYHAGKIISHTFGALIDAYMISMTYINAATVGNIKLYAAYASRDEDAKPAVKRLLSVRSLKDLTFSILDRTYILRHYPDVIAHFNTAQQQSENPHYEPLQQIYIDNINRRKPAAEKQRPLTPPPSFRQRLTHSCSMPDLQNMR